jgi:hypothetical protein
MYGTVYRMQETFAVLRILDVMMDQCRCKIGGVVPLGHSVCMDPTVGLDVVLTRIDSLVEEIYNTPTVALRVVVGDEKGIQCLGVELGHTVTGGHKYSDLVLQVGG